MARRGWCGLAAQMLCTTVFCIYICSLFFSLPSACVHKKSVVFLALLPAPLFEHLPMGQARNPQTQRTPSMYNPCSNAIACMHCMCVMAMETGPFIGSHVRQDTFPRLHIQAHSAERLVQVVTDTSIPPRWRELQLERHCARLWFDACFTLRREAALHNSESETRGCTKEK